MYRMTLLFVAPWLVVGCNHSEGAVGDRMTLAHARADVAAGGRGRASLNPNPQRAYRVTLRIHNAPGEFKYVKGGAQYDVVNEDECGSINPKSGTPSRITSQEDVLLTRLSATEYTGVVYADYMRDDDLYGRGTCRWELTGTSVRMKVTGAHEETRFMTFMEASDVVAGRRHTRYYTTRNYPKAASSIRYPHLPRLQDYGDTGAASVDEFLPEFREGVFSFTLDAAEFRL